MLFCFFLLPFCGLLFHMKSHSHLEKLKVQRHAYAHVFQLVQTRVPDAAFPASVDCLRAVVFSLDSVHIINSGYITRRDYLNGKR